MILKQRWEDGRTTFTDIGNNFQLLQQSFEGFNDELQKYFPTREDQADMHAIIEYGEKQIEPLYKGFRQWIYTNDGQLFQDLTYES